MNEQGYERHPETGEIRRKDVARAGGRKEYRKLKRAWRKARVTALKSKR